MTRQERNAFWIGMAVLCAGAIVAEYMVAPSGPAKPVVILVCLAVIGYVIYRTTRQKRRRRSG